MFEVWGTTRSRLLIFLLNARSVWNSMDRDII